MIKGAQKQMIVLRTGKSHYFDEAYFVLRREVKWRKSNQNDILKEATRILEESEPSSHRKWHRTRRLGWLLLGALLGSGGAVGICLLFLL